MAQAARFIRFALGTGERPQTEVEAEAEQEGKSTKTLHRAAKEGVAKRKDGFRGPWMWKFRECGRPRP